MYPPDRAYKREVLKHAKLWFLAFLLLAVYFLWINRPPKFLQTESKALFTINFQEVNAQVN